MANGKGKGKKKTGLIIGLVFAILLLGGGAVVGLALAGKINIPGLTPKKKKPTPPKEEKKKPKIVVPPKKVVPPPAKAPVMLTQQGAAKIGEVWNEMPTDKLLKVVGKWKPNELAVVLNEMDSVKVADLLGTMQPETASLISREMKRLASIPTVN